MPKRRPLSPGDPSPPDVANPLAHGVGYAPMLKAGVAATTSHVQEMHHAITGHTFYALQRMPGWSVTARLAQGAHDAITHGLYAAFRHGAGAMLAMAGEAERHVTQPGLVQALPWGMRGTLDTDGQEHVAPHGPLALPMQLLADGHALKMTRGALASLSERVCVFIHGLACDEHSWQLHPDAWIDSDWDVPDAHYGALLEGELGFSSLYLRYNSTVNVGGNGEQLALLLQRLMRMAPQVRELVLIGHSMGGLVARRACEYAQHEGMTWLRKTAMLISLGSPHQQTPMPTAVWTIPAVTATGARASRAKPVALRFIAGSLADETELVMSDMIGHLLGDGLVSTRSASDTGLTGDVQRIELSGLGHMGLLNHPRVYAVIRDWLGGADSA